MIRRRWGIALSLAGILGWGAEVQGQTTFSWNNASGGSFHSASNWNPGGGPPIFDDFANFNIAGTYGVTFSNAGTQTIDFQVRQGTVSMSYINTTAQHFWGGAGTNRVGPLAGDAASSATLNLLNMSNNPMSGHDLIIGHAAGKTGTMNIFTNGRWQGYATSDVTVGSAGTGNLNITTSGILQNSSMSANNIAFGTSGGTGNGLISGVNASMTVGNVLTVGEGNSSLANVTVSNAGKLNVLDTVYIGVASTANNQLTVTGTNSELVLGNDALAVGFAGGRGTLNVLAGGKVTNSAASMTFANDVGTVGNLLVDGANSQFQSTGSQTLVVGNQGTSTATISNGGNLTVSRFRIGGLAGSNGTMTITGTGSAVSLTGSSFNEIGASGTGTLLVQNNASLTSSASLEIGFSGTGSMSISGGADVVSNSGRLGVATGSSGQASVTGFGSTWNASSSGNFVVGQSGAGSMTVSAGGAMTTTSVSLASMAGGSGTVLVTDSGSIWNHTGPFFIGDAGAGSVAVRNSGDIIGTSNLIIGQSVGSVGHLLVSDPGSLVSQSSGNAITVGFLGQGTLLVNNGGTVASADARIGVGNGSLGTATISGLNSSLTTTGYLSVGGSSLFAGGAGTVNINNSGQVNVGSNLILWGSGSIQLNGGILHLNTITDSGGQFNWNTGTVNFKQNTVLTDALADILFAGGNHTLNNGKTLGATGFTLIANTPMIVDGGKIAATGYTNINTTQLMNGIISLTGNFLNDVQGTMMIQGIGQMNVAGTLQNNGLMAMQGLGARSSGGTLQNNGILTGSGQLNHVLQNNATGTLDVNQGERLIVNSPITASTNLGLMQLLGGRLDFTGQLTNASGGMITGRGVLAASTASPGALGLINRGVLSWSAGTGDVFGDVRNESTGQIITTGGGVTTFHDDVEHNGMEIRTSAGSRTVFLGSVSGASPYTGTGVVHYEGDLRPGNSPANVQYAGDVEFSVTARLITEIGGLLPGSEYDRLTVQGLVTLGGQLEVALLSGFVPGAGDSFIIVDKLGSDPVIGTFTGLSEGSSFVSGGQLWSITYQGGSGNDVLLMAVPEPATWALLGVSTLGTAGGWWYRRRKMSEIAEQEV